MNELSKISKIMPRTINMNDIVRDYLRWHFTDGRIFNENAEIFIQAHLSKRQNAEKLVKKLKELISADFQLDDFWNEYPPKKIKENNEREIDWEIFREISVREKEKRIMIKERMLETIFYYAEKNEEVRSLLKSI